MWSSWLVSDYARVGKSVESMKCVTEERKSGSKGQRDRKIYAQIFGESRNLKNEISFRTYQGTVFGTVWISMIATVGIVML